MHFLSTYVRNFIILTQLPDGCVSFQIVLFFVILQLIYCVCLMSMLLIELNAIQFNSMLRGVSVIERRFSNVLSPRRGSFGGNSNRLPYSMLGMCFSYYSLRRRRLCHHYLMAYFLYLLLFVIMFAIRLVVYCSHFYCSRILI